ncbi:hypothetical protein V8E54_010176 [Elaphomyces granulatus]
MGNSKPENTKFSMANQWKPFTSWIFPQRQAYKMYKNLERQGIAAAKAYKTETARIAQDWRLQRKKARLHNKRKAPRNPFEGRDIRTTDLNHPEAEQTSESQQPPPWTPMMMCKMSIDDHRTLFELSQRWSLAYQEAINVRMDHLSRWPTMYGEAPIGHLRRLNNMKKEAYAARGRSVDHLTRIMELEYRADPKEKPMSQSEMRADPPVPFEKSYLADTKFEGQYKFPSTRESPLKHEWIHHGDGKATKRLKRARSLDSLDLSSFRKIDSTQLAGVYLRDV